MRKWKLSRYTRVVDEPGTGDLLLHNSFMGAVARIPFGVAAEIEPFLDRGREKHRDFPMPEFRDDAMSHPALRELSDGGFFVPTDVDEKGVVEKVIAAERNAGFGIILLPHENCNFRCTYCYESFERGRMKPEIVSGVKAFIEAKAGQVSSLSLSWFGGEPLLAKDIIYDLSDFAIETCERRGISYKSGITTNGYFLSKEVAGNLLRRKVNHFQITLDGAEETHNKARKLISGGGTYRRILDNLVSLRDIDEEFTVAMRVNFSHATLSTMDDFLNEVVPLFKDDRRFFMDFHAVGKWGGPNDAELDVCDAESAESAKIRLARRALRHGYSDEGLKNSLMPHGSVCYAGKESSIVVGSDGTVYKCTVAFDDPRNKVGRLTPRGELLVDQALWDLWTKLDGKEAGKCTTCSFNPSCQSRSCPLAAIQENEPPCPYTVNGYTSLVRLVGRKRKHRDLELA